MAEQSSSWTVTANDPRLKHYYAELNGKNYRRADPAPANYLLAVPEKGDFKGTIFLIHGWPDLSMGWRNQIPPLVDMGYRVVCPDIMGFGGTDAPRVPPESIALYGYKRAADDIQELARQLGAPEIILGGHDWGGAIAYRVALWHPQLVTHLFSVCTPFSPPSKQYKPLEFYVEKGILPNFAYQLRLADGQVEGLKSRDEIRQLLNGVYGGRGPNGEAAFDAQNGVYLDRLAHLSKNRLVEDEMLDYYADQYVKNGMHGPSNWYRTKEQNFQDELELDKTTIDIPVLFIQAMKDEALPPAMSRGMGQYLPQLTWKTVQASHWALWETADEVNGYIVEWLGAIEKHSHSTL